MQDVVEFRVTSPDPAFVHGMISFRHGLHECLVLCAMKVYVISMDPDFAHDFF